MTDPDGSRPEPTVLVVDDEPEVLEMLVEFLERLGYAAVTAPNGVAGLQALEKQEPDAVLLDITMPGLLGGVQTLRAIKSARPDLPVVMVTANVDLDVAKAALREGAFDYVMKPMDLTRVRDVLSQALIFAGKTPPP